MELRGGVAVLSLELLGPMRVRRDDVWLPAPAGKVRALLTLLALETGTAVSRERMAAELWGDTPPPSASANLRTYLSRLRVWLAEVTQVRGDQVLIQGPGGWQLKLGALKVEVDVFTFDRMLKLGRRAAAAREHETAAGHLRHAVGLYRGAPMQDVPQGRVLSGRACALTAAWLSAVEDYVALLVGLARYDSARAVLHEFLAVQPYRERAWGQLMVACGNSGDVQGALHAYNAARHGLIEGLGVEPSTELTNLYQQILRGEPAVRLATHIVAPTRVGSDALDMSGISHE